MLSSFHARFSNNADSSTPVWQPLKDHLLNVAKYAKEFATICSPSDDWLPTNAYYAGLLHDVGKYSAGFQKMLANAAEGKPANKSPHSVYGAAWAVNLNLTIQAAVIIGHHAGLHNLRLKLKELAGDALLKEDTSKLLSSPDIYADFPELKEHLQTASEERLLDGSEKGMPNDLDVRMLFSCLVDADRLDSAAFERGRIPGSELLNARKKLDQLCNFINDLKQNSKPSRLNDIRNNIFQACLDAGKWPEKLLSLAVPTGAGKTLSSMAYALSKAANNPDSVNRIIVVIPFLSIIEQNAAVYKNVFGDQTIFEHHSGNLINERPKSEQNEYHSPWERLSEENWDAPIIVTTSVRFFESLFSNKPRDLRRIHNIANSVVVIDEVQSIPVKYFHPVMSMIRELSEKWNTTFLLSTATQPAFEKEDDADKADKRWEAGTIKPIITDEKQKEIFDNLQRVQNPLWPGTEDKISWEDLAEKLIAEPRVLCIVNTKKHAYDLYHALKKRLADSGQLESGHLFHLSTLMCPAHRFETLARITNTLSDSDKPCRVISTQLVEAGVDLDFPVVYRAMAPFSSIIQAAGRCNREGKLNGVNGEPGGRLVVFNPAEKGNPYPTETDVTALMMNNPDLSIHNPGQATLYFENLYGKKNLDVENIETLRKQYNYKDVSNHFQLIQQDANSMIVPFSSDANKLVQKMELSGAIDKQTLRLLQQYMVSLAEYQFKEVLKQGLIYELFAESNIWVAHSSHYSPETGFCAFNTNEGLGQTFI